MSKAVEPFRFRQFEVAHDRCAMRVNTDAVLLGAWCPLPDAGVTGGASPRMLDVGTGSGVIALMLAQRCPSAAITAIDIDEPSALQAADNFRRSPWADRLSAQHISLQDFAGNLTSPTSLTSCSIFTSPTSFARAAAFQLIISNPPYFRNALRNPDPTRSQARHTDSLSFDDLCRCASSLLVDGGTLALVLPADAEEDILATAAACSLYPTYLTRVHTNASLPPKRILLVLKKQLSIVNCQLSTILIGSAEYHALCEDFYL